MYQLIRAYARKDRRSGRWEEINLTQMPLRDISQHYPDVCFIITYPALQGGERALYWSDVANITKDLLSTTTVQEWLTSMGNQSLPLKTTVPDFRERMVKYINAWYGNFQLDPMGPSRRLEPDVSKFDKPDLFIRHPDVTGPDLRRQVMVSINGFFHFTEYTPDGILVHQGNQSILTANQNQIGIHSFRDVAPINYVNITPDMIFNKKDEDPLINGVFVNLPGEPSDYDNKTILFVMNGYLQALGKGYNRVGLTSFKIQLHHLMLIERFYHSQAFLDMQDVPLTHYPNNPTLISTKEFHSDAMIEWWLNRSQTFFVVVDTPSMFHDLDPVEHLNLPGRFMDQAFVPYPLVGTYGCGLEYRTLRYPAGKTVMATPPNHRHRYDFHRRLWEESPATTAGRNSEVPFTHDHAYWRLLGTQDPS